MNTKNIFKTLAAAMMMPAMLLTTSCSSEDDALNTPAENIAKKGYTLPVTVNVTRQGDDATTRATYTYDEDAKKGTLAFSEGDKLFVSGFYDDDYLYDFTGVLTWQPGDTFSGTIYLEGPFEGTAEELLNSALHADATLLPAGYGGYGFLSIENEGTCDATLKLDNTKAFALTKAAAVEQFSYESAEEYSNGFVLTPSNAIVSFTISGLAENTAVAVLFKDDYNTSATPVNITTDESGVATFASAMYKYDNFNDYSLTVDGNAITLPADKTVEAGKIYNITRSAAPATVITDPAVGQIIGSDGKNYAADATLPSGVTAVAMIAYLGNGSDCTNGLAIALADESGTMTWSAAGTACSGKTAVTGGTWRLPSIKDWQNMFIGCGASGTVSDSPSSMSYSGLASKLSTAGGTALQSGIYWSSTENSPGSYAWDLGFADSRAYFHIVNEGDADLVRACLAF